MKFLTSRRLPWTTAWVPFNVLTAESQRNRCYHFAVTLLRESVDLTGETATHDLWRTTLKHLIDASVVRTTWIPEVWASSPRLRSSSRTVPINSVTEMKVACGGLQTKWDASLRGRLGSSLSAVLRLANWGPPTPIPCRAPSWAGWQ